MLATATTTIAVTAAVLCNNYNWEYSPRCTAEPDMSTFVVTDNGFEGYLTSGVRWEQYWIAPELMEFRMEDVRWHIYRGQIVSSI